MTLGYRRAGRSGSQSPRRRASRCTQLCLGRLQTPPPPPPQSMACWDGVPIGSAGGHCWERGLSSQRTVGLIRGQRGLLIGFHGRRHVIPSVHLVSAVPMFGTEDRAVGCWVRGAGCYFWPAGKPAISPEGSPSRPVTVQYATPYSKYASGCDIQYMFPGSLVKRGDRDGIASMVHGFGWF